MFFQYDEPDLEHARNVLNDHEDSFELIKMRYDNTNEPINNEDISKLESITSDCIDILLSSAVQDEVMVKSTMNDYRNSVFYKSGKLKMNISLYFGNHINLIQ